MNVRDKFLFVDNFLQQLMQLLLLSAAKTGEKFGLMGAADAQDFLKCGVTPGRHVKGINCADRLDWAGVRLILLLPGRQAKQLVDWVVIPAPWPGPVGSWLEKRRRCAKYRHGLG